MTIAELTAGIRIVEQLVALGMSAGAALGRAIRAIFGDALSDEEVAVRAAALRDEMARRRDLADANAGDGAA